MPRESLDLVPDDHGVRAVRGLWDRLRDAGLPSQADHRGHSNKVHCTLAEAPSIVEPERAVRVLAPMLPLTLPVTGLVVLGGGRAAVALLLSAPPELLAAVTALRDGVGQESPPWVPHVTLARQVPREQVGRVVDAVGATGVSALRLVQLRQWRPATAEVTVLAPL